jgi:hypothetical protein
MKFGSYEHKKLFCRSFIDSHIPHDPKHLPWPKLDDQSLKRLHSISFWPDLLKQQQKAALIVKAYAQTIRDPLMKEAIALLAEEEEGLEKRLSFMMEFYSLPNSTVSSVRVSNKTETAFIDRGFEECLNSFLGFGMFGIAKQAHYLPEPLMQAFDSCLEKKARQIIFFINWWTYWNIKLKQRSDWNEFRGIRALWFRRQILVSLITAFEKEEFEEVSFDQNLSAGQLMGKLTLGQFLSVCQAEQVGRMQGFNSNLLQPQLANSLASFMQTILKFWPQRVGSESYK